MINVAIVGASGYAGAELVRLLCEHKDVNLTHLFVSEKSADANALIRDLYGTLRSEIDLQLEPLSTEKAVTLTAEDFDVVFLATEHQVSHDLAPIFIDNGICVIDLSGAFRLTDLDVFEKYYGFSFGKTQKELMNERVYGLVDWVSSQQLQTARLISMPGCYPTASELALKPLTANHLLDTSMPPVINAVSGVSGAGRKAKLTNSFCEVSLNAYGLFKHRHLPEIEEQVGCNVIFNPHLGDFKRGILATITARLKPSVSDEDLAKAYNHAYKKASHGGVGAESLETLVRLKSGTVRLQDVQHLPFCDISYVRQGDYIIISSAIDNLLKGAASQAIEAMNLHFGLPRARGLL